MNVRDEFETWIAADAARENRVIRIVRERDWYAGRDKHFLNTSWSAWQASRIPTEATKATAWRVIDAKGKRYTVYNKDLAMAISDAGLHVAPMCDVPPEGWECSRSPGHEGPCAAYEVAS